MSHPPPNPPGSVPAGWFPDPLGRHEYRYFNGVAWTSDVSDGGRRLIDPLGTRPGGTAPGGDTGNGRATAALTCGIIAVAIAWVPFVVAIGVVLGVLALVFGISGLRRSQAVGRGRAMAITGIVTGGLAMVLAVVGVALSVVMFRAVSDFVEPGPVETEVTDCRLDGREAAVTGTLTNRSRSERGYTLFVDVGGELAVVEFDPLPPGGTAEWSARVRAGTVLAECVPALIVNGPFPFGIELDPVER
ncbi:MAG TPA: DUF2510 domain-containing protein [Ilumatobacter sp.]